MERKMELGTKLLAVFYRRVAEDAEERWDTDLHGFSLMIDTVG